MDATVSIIIPCLNEGDNVIDTVDAVLRNTDGTDFEVIVVDDGSSDKSLAHMQQLDRQGDIRLVQAPRIGPARCRNLGAGEAKGERLVFLDAHCYLPPGWLPPLMRVLDERPEVGVVGPIISNTGNFQMHGYGGTWEDDRLDMSWLKSADGVTEVPFQPAGCQMVRREIFEKIGGYDEGMTRWGSEDVEFCIRVWLFGNSICVQPESMVYHYFRNQPPYDVDMPQIVYNKLRMIFLHFGGERLQRALVHQLSYPHVSAALARLYTDETPLRRQHLWQRRVRDMDWFCQRFGFLT